MCNCSFFLNDRYEYMTVLLLLISKKKTRIQNSICKIIKQIAVLRKKLKNFALKFHESINLLDNE
jgi:hypothetical protein